MVVLYWQVKIVSVKTLSYLLYQIKLTLYQIIVRSPYINSSYYIMIMIYNLVLIGTKLNIFKSWQVLKYQKHIQQVHFSYLPVANWTGIQANKAQPE